MTRGKILIICVLCTIGHGDKINEKILRPTCGIDNSSINVVYEGTAVIQTYPWLGTLFYPIRGKRFVTAVVLISTQVCVGSAFDIDKLPKTDFRYRSRVVLGNNCNGPPIGVREYSYHPTYNRTTYSALVLIQLETEYLNQKLRPICSPPAAWNKPQFYAVTLSNDCNDSKVKIHKMSHVSLGKCKSYYKRSGLDVAGMWPTHTICARTLHGRECVWRNGAVLMLRQNDTWSLAGFGVAGPGCRAPARFIDYGMSYLWATQSIARIGKPAVTRIARNHLVMRRTTGRLQRHGHCDPEEIKEELYTDSTAVLLEPKTDYRRVRYNFTILSKMEYSCIIFRVENEHMYWDPPMELPLIKLRRWCTSSSAICYSTQYVQIDFYVEIYFSGIMKYKVAAYGEETKLLDIKRAMAYTNFKRKHPAVTG